MMNNLQLEKRVLDIIKRVESGQPNEDSRVELKSKWIPVEKAAQRLGGHANAARGEDILWIVGVDEENGVVGADNKELANWYPQVQSRFDERFAPELLKDLNVPIGNKTVVALLFATDRAPFVVKKPTTGDVLEVPWREGTRIRTATRSHLIKLLSPLEILPSIQILKANLFYLELPYTDIEKREPDLLLDLLLYITPQSEKKLVIPFHQCSVSYKLPQDSNQFLFDFLKIEPAEHYSRGLDRVSSNHFMKKTPYEVIISDSGMVSLTAERKSSTREEVDRLLYIDASRKNDVEIIAKLFPVNNELPVSINVPLSYSGTETMSELMSQNRFMYNRLHWSFNQ